MHRASYVNITANGTRTWIKTAVSECRGTKWIEIEVTVQPTIRSPNTPMAVVSVFGRVRLRLKRQEKC